MLSKLNWIFFVFIFSFVFARPVFANQPTQQKSRIVSLAPNLTEIIFALGLEKNLVAVTEQCDYPENAKRIEKVGIYGRPVKEAILAKKPSVVLVTEGVDRAFVESLEKSKIAVLKFRSQSLIELKSSILDLGEKLDAVIEAKKLVATIDEKQLLVSQKNRVKKTYLTIISGSPVFSISDNTLMAQLLNLTGLTNNVRDTKTTYPQLSLEFVLATNPDVLFVTHGLLREANVSITAPTWQKDVLTFIGRGRYRFQPKTIVLPNDVFERAGPRVVQAMDYLMTASFDK